MTPAGPASFTEVEFRLTENQTPGPRGEITIGRVDFTFAGQVWIMGAPVIASLYDASFFVGIPGGRNRGLAWSPGFGRHLAEAVRRVAVEVSGDPDWPAATIARIRASHPEHRQARAKPPGAATTWRTPTHITSENNHGL